MRLSTQVISRAKVTGNSHAQGSLENWGDTVGELKSAEICVSHMPSLKAKKLGKLPQKKYS
jgi:hypothetical protein